VHALRDIGLTDVQAEYGTADGDISHLIMGEQLHVGGLQSTLALAARAGIRPGMEGIDLCCFTGAGMRALVRFCRVDRMVGVDATERVVERGRETSDEEGFRERVIHLVGDACATGLPARSADFVWGEDAWCYVEDKPALIHEAARLLRSGGVVAFTDWVEGPSRMAPSEAERLLRFMRFPSILDLVDYSRLLAEAGLQVEIAEDTGRFAPCVELYRDIVTMQLTYDALKAVGFDAQRMEALERERDFVRQLAREGKLIQSMFVARKPRESAEPGRSASRPRGVARRVLQAPMLGTDTQAVQVFPGADGLEPPALRAWRSTLIPPAWDGRSGLARRRARAGPRRRSRDSGRRSPPPAPGRGSRAGASPPRACSSPPRSR
jgi:SAM-dependent methyltransferase